MSAVPELRDTIDSGMSANQVEQKSRVNMVNEAIKMLSADDAQVIGLFYKGEQTLEEIAAIFQAERPTRERFEAAYEAGRLPVDRARWSSRWLVLFDGPALSDIAFWGSSGD